MNLVEQTGRSRMALYAVECYTGTLSYRSAIVPGGRPAPSSRFRGGVLHVTLTKPLGIDARWFTRVAVKSFARGSATGPLRVSRSTSVESRCAVR